MSSISETISNICLPVHTVSKNRKLIFALTLRMWRSRGKDGLFAALWPILTPFILLGVYYYVFGVILDFRQGVGGANYALSMFCGISVFNIFAESMNSGAQSMIAHPGYVKNAMFDLEVLPLSGVGCALISGLIYLLTVFAAAGCSGIFRWQAVMVPVSLLPYLLFCAGIAMFCGAMSVFLRDFPIFLLLLQQGLFFLTPIIYPMSKVPETYRKVIEYNPLTGYVESIRSALLGNVEFANWHWLWINGIAVYLLGFCFFRKTRKGFADVI